MKLRSPSATILSFLGLFGFGLCWSVTIPLAKIAVSTGYQPISLIFWQLFFSIIFIGPVLFLKGIKVPLTKQGIIFFVIVALIGTLLPNSFSYLATANLPAGIVAIAIATVPMFSLIIALIFGIEKFILKRSLGVLLGVSAMALIALPKASLPQPGQSLWVAVALIAPLCYGCEGNYIARKGPANMHPLAMLWGASVVGIGLAAIFSLIYDTWLPLFSIKWGSAEWAILGSSIGHMLAYSGYIWLLGFAGAVFSAQIAYVVTIGAIMFSILILNESYSSYIWVAMVMMLVGLTFVQPIGKLPDREE